MIKKYIDPPKNPKVKKYKIFSGKRKDIIENNQRERTEMKISYDLKSQ